MQKEKINLTDNLQNVIVKMSEGNPGAVGVIMAILESKVDPDNALGGLGALLSLDSYSIYGTDIYILNNDICKGDVTKTIAILRAVQLGFFSANILKDACHRQDRSGVSMIPVEELYLKVKKELPNFDQN